MLVKDITNKKMKETIFAIDNNKAPGLDGSRVCFFKEAYGVMEEDVVKAIKHFFHMVHLLKEMNCVILALVPKVSSPSFCKDYRPIACCNTLYKCITKIMANHLKPILPRFINKAQSAFVGRNCIGENILLCQELLYNYHKPSKDKKCTIKIDLMKAYDSLN